MSANISTSRASGALPDTVTVDGDKLTVMKVDDAVNTTFICEVKNKHGTSRNQIIAIVNGESIGGRVNSALSHEPPMSLLRYVHTPTRTHMSVPVTRPLGSGLI